MITLFKIIIGTTIGSFLSLVSVRSNRHESIIFPPSHCDYCHHRLSAWEMIPIISFILLKGRCSHCRKPIGIINLEAEIIGGLIVGTNPIRVNGILETGFELILLLLALDDWQSFKMPSGIILTLAGIGVVQLIKFQNLNWPGIAAKIMSYLIILKANSSDRLIGNGDVDVIFIILLKTNLLTTAIVILIASSTALIKFLITRNSKTIPFIPYLTFGYLAVNLL